MRDIFASSIRKWSSLTWAAITVRYPAHTLHVNLTRPRFEGKKGMSRAYVWGAGYVKEREIWAAEVILCAETAVAHKKPQYKQYEIESIHQIRLLFETFSFFSWFLLLLILPPSSQ